ncbi:asl5268 [Nostoc sp. PCC 7120 = FACHB-418]|nr:asl5268 [Nostoc sp. PCC 7120 = FACHB-418]
MGFQLRCFLSWSWISIDFYLTTEWRSLLTIVARIAVSRGEEAIAYSQSQTITPRYSTAHQSINLEITLLDSG